MGTGLTHAHVSSGTNAGTGDVHKEEWNAKHVGSPFALDRYDIDGTYGDDFTGGSLSGSWTRRNFTSGAEEYQKGIDGSFIRISENGRAVGDGYFRTAPAGDFTLASKLIKRGHYVSAQGMYPAIIDSSGNGVAVVVYTAPVAVLLIKIATYSTYSSAYTQIGLGAAPNVNQLSAYPVDVPIWTYIRKSGSDYFLAYSLDGEVWSHESNAFNYSFTVDRIGFMLAPLSTVGGSGVRTDLDWINKIA